MSTKILDYEREKRLQPAHALWQRYQPKQTPYAFKAKTLVTAKKWQKKTRLAFGKLLGLDQLTRPQLAPRLLERVDKGDYIREKISLQTSAHTLMPVYLLLPKQVSQPQPTVLAFHGHGYGVKDIVGLWENGEERDTPDGYQGDFGIALCRAGFVVAAPEISCFGERLTSFAHLDSVMGQTGATSCTQAAMLAAHLGLTVLGMRVHDSMRLVDYLETRPEIDARRLGAMGISGGGMHTFFSSCLDTRIKASVVSGYFSTFQDSILSLAHCACNFVPGLGQFGEMSDLAGLIAPRPILIEAGTKDQIFPIKAVRKGVREARKIYATFGTNANARILTDYFEGRHRINGTKAYTFLRKHL